MRLAYDWHFYLKVMKNTNAQLEIWKDIPGYEGFYQASNLGNIKSLSRTIYRSNGRLQRIKERILKSANSKGYRNVSLRKNGKARSFQVQKLMAMAFLGHVPCGYEEIVDHKNNIRHDNRLENLQLITNRENLSKDRKGKSQYTGVWKNRENWCARIVVNKIKVNLGSFKNELEAHEYYQNALKLITDGGKISDIVKKERVVASKYLGVCWHKTSKKWKAHFKRNKKTYNLGYFTNEYDAHLAVEKGLKKYNENIKQLP